MNQLIAMVLAIATMAPAPDFTLKGLDGKSVSLSQHRGEIVVLNFWATWCPPCRTEIPWLMQLQDTFGADRLVVLGVAMDDVGAEAIAPFVKNERFLIGQSRRPINYPILLGNEATADAYGVEGLPMTVLIGRDGTAVHRYNGAFKLDELDRAIRKLLAAK